MARLDFIPDFEFNLVRLAWIAIFALMLQWGHSLKRPEAPVALEAKVPAAVLAR